MKESKLIEIEGGRVHVMTTVVVTKRGKHRTSQARKESSSESEASQSELLVLLNCIEVEISIINFERSRSIGGPNYSTLTYRCCVNAM